MSKKFINKISAERLVLACANQFTNGKKQLTGLTMKSITAWTHINRLEKGNSIELLLLEFSDMCYRMTDRSQEAFESMDEIYLNQIKNKIPELQVLMSDYFQ